MLIGTITWYAGPYVKQPLRCGGVYDETHAWIAVDLDAYHPEWRCNDLAEVDAGGVRLLLRVLDSGPLSNFCVYFGDTCVPIVGDLPQHAFPWPGLSVRGSVRNVTGGLRARLEVER